MMAQAHPTEIELLDYVEGDADASAISVLRAHVETCSACSATVSELGRARATLRAAPLFELPAARAETMLGRLPRQERDRPTWLALLRSPRRLALVLAPAAAAAAGVVALVVYTGNGDQAERGAAPSAAVAEELKAEAQADASAGAAEAPLEAAPLEEAATLEEPAPPPAAEPPAEEATGGPLPIATVAGQPDEVAKILREAGFAVQVTEGAVTVTGASEADVTEALEGVPPGEDVPVFVEP